MSGEWRADKPVLLFDVSDRVQIEITGRDRVRFLHSFCTNDIKKLHAGQDCEAFVTNVNGKVLGHIFVFAEQEALWLDSVSGAAASLLPHFEKYVITEDVRFVDRTADFAEFLLVGEQSTELLERLSVHAGSLSLNEHLLLNSDQLPARSVRRIDWFKSPTWSLQVPLAHRDAVWNALAQAGAETSNEETFHALRITAGFPLYGIDVTEENLAQEVGRTSQAVSFTKGCYLGQEPIARIDAMGHVNRQLCRLQVFSASPPRAGATVLDKLASDAKVIGMITSSVKNQLGDPNSSLALAYLRSAFVKADETVFVENYKAVVL